MFPLKTLVLAATLAVAFGPSLMACPAHNHMQTTAAPTADETVTTTSSASTQPAEVASADQATKKAGREVIPR